MITVKVTGKPILTVTGGTYTASIPVAAYDYGKPNEEWALATTTLTITGATSDTLLIFKAALKTQTDAWKLSLAAMQTLKAKLDKIEGLEL